MGYKQKNAAINQLKGDVMQDILKRTPLGDTLYEIALDHKITENRIRKWVMPILGKYKHLRKLWIDSLIETERLKHDSNSHNTP